MTPLELQLLSEPRVVRNGQPLHIGSRKALAILAVVALDSGATRSRLTALLWPELDAAAGRRNLRRELFRLRELEVPIDEEADGRLCLGASVAVDAAQPAASGMLPTRAGAPLDGLDGVGSAELDLWLQRWRERLAAGRDAALAREAQASEERGDLAKALSLQAHRWDQDPCAEEVAVEVMRLRAALGNRSGALRDYRRLAEALRKELGVDPSAAAQDFADEMRRDLTADAGPRIRPQVNAGLRVDPATTNPTVSADDSSLPYAVPAMSAPALPAVAPFVPRRRAAAQIESAWANRQRVYLHGPAGIGKTRLASELAAARGAWLRVACEPQDVELPYASVVRLLRALRESATDVELPAWVRRELSQLMPEFGEPPQSLATDEARQRLLAAAAEAWRLLMHDNFSVLVLDDWHWGDAASVELWSRLDDSAAGSVAWIISYRSAQLPQAALARQRADLDSRRAVSIGLDGMAASEVLELTKALSGSAGGRLFSQRLHRATEGNPFFLLETLRHLFEQGLLTADARGWSTPFDDHTEDYAELPVPTSVRDAVLSRVRALGEVPQRLLEAASLCSGDIETRLLAGVAAGIAGEEAIVAALEHGGAAQLLAETRSGWRFAHDLVRQSLAQSLSPARRRLLHERLARRLGELAAPAGLVAAQWEAAGRRLDAVPWRIAAAESALRLHALAESQSHYGQALDDGATGVVAARIHRALAQLHRRRADRAAVDAAFGAAVAAAAGDPVEGDAEVLSVQLDRAHHLSASDRVDEALALLESMSGDLLRAPPAPRALGLTAVGTARMALGQHNVAARLMGEAADLLHDRPEAREQLGALLIETARLGLRSGDLDAAMSAAQRAVIVNESIGLPGATAHALTLKGVVELYRGDRSRARDDLSRARDLAQRAGNVPVHRGAILNLVKLYTDDGDAATAVRLLDEGEALAPSYEHRRSEQAFREARYFVHYLRGEVSEARAAAERLLVLARDPTAVFEWIGALHLVVDLHLLTGDLAQASALLEEAQAVCDRFAIDVEGSLYDGQQRIKQAWLALAEGRADESLSRLPALERLTRDDDRYAVAWIGARACRLLGDGPAARRFLDLMTLDSPAAIDHYAPWLTERLAAEFDSSLARASAIARARELLASGKVPMLCAEGLLRAAASAAAWIAQAESG